MEAFHQGSTVYFYEWRKTKVSLSSKLLFDQFSHDILWAVVKLHYRKQKILTWETLVFKRPACTENFRTNFTILISSCRFITLLELIFLLEHTVHTAWVLILNLWFVISGKTFLKHFRSDEKNTTVENFMSIEKGCYNKNE